MAEFDVLLPPGPLSQEGGGAYIRALSGALGAAGHSVTQTGGRSPGVIRSSMAPRSQHVRTVIATAPWA